MPNQYCFAITHMEEGPGEQEFSFVYSTRGTASLNDEECRLRDEMKDIGELELVVHFNTDHDKGTLMSLFMKSDVYNPTPIPTNNFSGESHDGYPNMLNNLWLTETGFPLFFDLHLAQYVE